ncbi:uncharacterized protein [Lepeophtheirus salmonis]|uniref:uncharacterized protein n=1 Tax=Lepeophtheirus salmonis TaxID=72036 RepID=UPI001AE44F00|nr:uncharacterized protein LOC121114905 [Lepeophtheirus salmonis]
MEMDEGSVRVLDGRSDKVACMKRILLSLFLLLLTAILAGILWITLIGPPNSVCLEEKGFNNTRYTNPDGTYRELSYIFIEKEPKRHFYAFKEGKSKCLELGAEIWEVVGEEAEWNLFYNIASKRNIIGPRGSGIWINAIMNQKCPEQPSKNCVEEKAQSGHGLSVKWPSTGKISTYSKLEGRDDSADENCVVTTENGLWSSADCTYGFWTLCVKRNC